MAIFGKDMPTSGGNPPVMERERSDPFENLLNLPTAPQPSSTVIARGMTLTGSLQGEGTINIEGRVIGEIDSKGTVTITRTGEVQGPIATDTVQISGRVEGNITAREHLKLDSDGSIEGDISAAALTIETGGSFNGRSTMLRQGRGGGKQSGGAPRGEERRPYQSLDEDEDEDDFLSR